MREFIDIIVVDDSREICRLIQDSFERENNTRLTAVYTAADAIKALKEQKFDVALLDINLPDYDGRDLLRDLHKEYPDLLCAMITGEDSPRSAVKALQEGAFGYFTKPFVLEEVVHDVKNAVEKRNLIRQLKVSRARVIQQEKMAIIGQLAAGVAHEVNNPVGFINSNLTTLKKYFGRLREFVTAQDAALQQHSSSDTVNELRKKLKIDYILADIADLIDESQDGAERIKKIVEDLKLFSRQDSGQTEMADINEVMASALNIAWNELKYKCTVNKELGKLPLTICSSQKLSQVFINILVNGAHAIAKNGEINITTAQRQNEIIVTISDSGCGMSKEVAAKIFDPFFTTKEAGKGTGLGMSVAAEIIKAHSGRIEVDSTPGRGTTFTIIIPVRE
ncbi:MAG: response regulator [Deltaproteobacteria bacterium]|nr:response regulator [Deltaproteobacteria bacterium]